MFAKYRPVQQAMYNIISPCECALVKKECLDDRNYARAMYRVSLGGVL